MPGYIGIARAGKDPYLVHNYGSFVMNTQLQMLDQAEQHFIHRRFQDGAALVWEAARQTIIAAGDRAGLPCEAVKDTYAIALEMNRLYPGEYMDHHLYLSLADIYRRQAATHDDPVEWQWEQRDYIENLSGIRAMVKNLAKA